MKHDSEKKREYRKSGVKTTIIEDIVGLKNKTFYFDRLMIG